MARVRAPDAYYLGILDDEVARHEPDWTIDNEVLNETLIALALFGPKVVINDGYLLHYAAGQEALISRTKSPLIDLNEAGFAVMLARNGNKLHEMPRLMAGKGVESYIRLVNSNHWDTLERGIRSFCESPSYRFEEWPKIDVGPGFVGVMNIVRNKALSELGLYTVLHPESFHQVQCGFDLKMDEDPNRPPRNA